MNVITDKILSQKLMFKNQLQIT